MSTTPVHYFGPGAAIYVREAAPSSKVAAFHLGGLEPTRRATMERRRRRASSGDALSFYLHEASTAGSSHSPSDTVIRNTNISSTLPYHANVVIPCCGNGPTTYSKKPWRQGEIYRRFRDEKVYRKGVPDGRRKATLRDAPAWFDAAAELHRSRRLPRDKPFDAATEVAVSQVSGGHDNARERKPSHGGLVPHRIRRLFDCQRIARILVPIEGGAACHGSVVCPRCRQSARARPFDIFESRIPCRSRPRAGPRAWLGVRRPTAGRPAREPRTARRGHHAAHIAKALDHASRRCFADLISALTMAGNAGRIDSDTLVTRLGRNRGTRSRVRYHRRAESTAGLSPRLARVTVEVVLMPLRWDELGRGPGSGSLQHRRLRRFDRAAIVT